MVNQWIMTLTTTLASYIVVLDIVISVVPISSTEERFRSKWMVRRSSIQMMPVEHCALFLTQRTTNSNISVFRWWSGCWMPIWFADQQITVFQATSIQFLGCPELSFWLPRFGPYGSLWAGRFGMLICQEHRLWMKWVIKWHSPQWQKQWNANSWARKL